MKPFVALVCVSVRVAVLVEVSVSANTMRGSHESLCMCCRTINNINFPFESLNTCLHYTYSQQTDISFNTFITNDGAPPRHPKTHNSSLYYIEYMRADSMMCSDAYSYGMIVIMMIKYGKKSAGATSITLCKIKTNKSLFIDYAIAV